MIRDREIRAACAAMVAFVLPCPLLAQSEIPPLIQQPAGTPRTGIYARNPQMAAEAAKKLAEAKAKPTPRRPDGHIDLSAIYSAPNGLGMTGEKKDGNVVLNFGNYGPGGKPAAQNPPQYKPELRAKVDYNDVHSSFVDKTFLCGMPGVPRTGPPQQIAQTDHDVILLYADVAGEVFRAIPIDGRGFRPEVDASYNGDSVGHWDGDTLVIDSKNFSDETWFGGRGYFHSDKMTVRETLKREGDVLTWTATVTDPEVLVAPWTTSRTLFVSDTRLEEPPPCQDIVRDHLVNNDNHS